MNIWTKLNLLKELNKIKTYLFTKECIFLAKIYPIKISQQILNTDKNGDKGLSNIFKVV